MPIHCDPEIMSGTPVFVGTRVPVQTLLDYLEEGSSLNEFLDHFPSVTREQVVAVLELAKDMLVAHARAGNGVRLLLFGVFGNGVRLLLFGV